MNKQEITHQLESLINSSKSSIVEAEDNEYNEIWLKDIESLNEAIKAVNLLDAITEVSKLKKRAEEAEMLLREVQPYVLQIDRDKISEFFKK